MKKYIILMLLMLCCLCGCSSKQSTKTTILCQSSGTKCSSTVDYKPSALYEIPNVICVETVIINTDNMRGNHIHYIVVYNEDN